MIGTRKVLRVRVVDSVMMTGTFDAVVSGWLAFATMKRMYISLTSANHSRLFIYARGTGVDKVITGSLVIVGLGTRADGIGDLV